MLASLAAGSPTISIRLAHDLQQQPQPWHAWHPSPGHGRLSGSKAMSGKTSMISWTSSFLLTSPPHMRKWPVKELLQATVVPVIGAELLFQLLHLLEGVSTRQDQLSALHLVVAPYAPMGDKKPTGWHLEPLHLPIPCPSTVRLLTTLAHLNHLSLSVSVVRRSLACLLKSGKLMKPRQART